MLSSAAAAARPVTNDPGSLVAVNLPINFDQQKVTLRTFFTEFIPLASKYYGDDEIGQAKMLAAMGAMDTQPKYLSLLQEVADHHRQSITLELDDLAMWQSGEHQALADQIQRNTHHYLGLIAAILDDLMPPPSPQAIDLGQMDVIDVLVSHRRARLARLENGTVVDVIPPTLLRRYDLLIKPCSANRQMLAVRQVGADQVGGLVTIRGIVTRVTEVKPLIQVATYSCEHCGWEVYQEVTTNAFLPLPECPSPDCRTGQRRGQLVLQSRGSRFVRFQEARIQEVSDQVPMGHIPRTMAVHLSGDLARSVAPGDLCAITGIFMPRPYSGYAAIRAGLLTDTYLQAMSIEPLRARYEQQLEMADQETLLMQMASDPEGYAKLARSIAPEIYGHEDVKKALLLLLVGGVTRNTGDGMRIRGDLNMCLMGDPGVAKSQLLKWVSSVAPRAVYTTGKGSSGVGLTASVGKDPVTGEMVLEGGALVLADTGICCIDEFDKMEEGDRTAIHEVMEQQTISISKAGITTTLNARTSILAAANPLHGRYNPKRSPVENINLPPALLSRFDLMFLLLDRPDLEADTRLAEHVTRVHRLGKAPEPEATGSGERISPDLLRRFIAHARQHEPMVPDHLADYITDAYVSLRQDDMQNPDSTYVTPRTLLGILRLSQALARLRFATTIQQSDVDEALRLMQASRHSLQVHREKHQRRQRQEGDASTRIYGLIKEMASRQLAADGEEGAKLLSMDTIRAVVGRNGFSLEQLEQCLVDFDQLHLWAVDPEGTHLKIFH